MESKKLPLELTGMEVVHLTDSIRNTDYADAPQGKEEFVRDSRSLLLLLGSLYSELVHANVTAEDGPRTILVSEEEAWLLRTKVKTTDVGLDGKTFIGAGLLLKLYALILEFANDVMPEWDVIVPMGDKLWNEFMGTKRGNEYKDKLYLDPTNDTPYKENTDA